jgi:uncharacterized membrane protein
MNWFLRHFSRSFVAGFVALLPIAGVVLTIVTLESSIAGPWRGSLPFYFPGMGIILSALIIYFIGLTVTTFLGRWLWRRFDFVVDNVPLVGSLYQTVKQILGYGGGKDAIFKQVVLVSNGEGEGEELGLVTNQVTDAEGRPMLMVFVPGAPTPTSGRMVVISPRYVRVVEMQVNDALKSLVAVGATPVPMERVRSATIPA